MTSARANPAMPTRVALVETSHWHVPLYLPALLSEDVRVVGVCDSAGLTGQALAKRFACEAYAGIDQLLEAQSFDLAFVFGRHCDMPGLAGKLIDRRIPFAIEKPCGIQASDVAGLAAAAELANLYVAVPFIFRDSDMARVVHESIASSIVDHASFRFMAGPPGRYLAAGTPWMLDAALAGGGPLINVGIHFIDLFSELCGHTVVAVSAQSSAHINHLSIEDTISVRLRARSGSLGTVECGYTFPSDKTVQREFSFSIRSPRAYLQSHPNGVFVRQQDATGQITDRVAPSRHEADLYYPEFAARVLADLRSGAAPRASLRDAERALRIVEAAYQSARRDGDTVKVAG